MINPSPPQPDRAPCCTNLEDDPRLLQEVRPHVGSDDVPFSAEADLDVLPEAAAVVVARGFRVPDRLWADAPLTEALRSVPKDGRTQPSLTSIMGLEAKTFSSTLVCCAAPPTTAKYLMVNLAETVFPDPDSPLMMMDWFFSSLHTTRRQ